MYILVYINIKWNNAPTEKIKAIMYSFFHWFYKKGFDRKHTVVLEFWIEIWRTVLLCFQYKLKEMFLIVYSTRFVCCFQYVSVAKSICVYQSLLNWLLDSPEKLLDCFLKCYLLIITIWKKHGVYSELMGVNTKYMYIHCTVYFPCKPKFYLSKNWFDQF